MVLLVSLTNQHYVDFMSQTAESILHSRSLETHELMYGEVSIANVWETVDNLVTWVLQQ